MQRQQRKTRTKNIENRTSAALPLQTMLSYFLLTEYPKSEFCNRCLDSNRFLIFPMKNGEYECLCCACGNRMHIFIPSLQSTNFIRFKGKAIKLDKTPRTGKCFKCGKSIGEKFIDCRGKERRIKQIHLHHKRYYDKQPLWATVELCASCHGKTKLGKPRGKYFTSEKTAEISKMASNPYLVVRRIMDKGKLWGVKIKWNNQYYKMAKDRLAEIIEHKIKTVLVDMKGQDVPVELILYNDTQFRTIKDGHLCNNFNKIKAIKLVTANKLKIKR